MRYFQRQALEPIIQAELDVKTSKNWGKLTEDQREEIVEKLMASQKSLCGYCECRISEKENAYHLSILLSDMMMTLKYLSITTCFYLAKVIQFQL